MLQIRPKTAANYAAKKVNMPVAVTFGWTKTAFCFVQSAKVGVYIALFTAILAAAELIFGPCKTAKLRLEKTEVRNKFRSQRCEQTFTPL